MAVDVGQASESGGEDWDAIRSRALAAGAVEAIVDRRPGRDGRGLLRARPQANAKYEGKYPLVSALSRPVIVKHLVAEARTHGADAVAHGCTGKGNDQVRFEVGTRALAPDLEVIAPARLWGLTREDCIEYAAKWDIPLVGDQGEAVLDRREPVGQGHRVRGHRGPLEPAARGRVHDDPAHGHRADRAGHRLRGRACRCRSTGARLAPEPLIAEVNRIVGSYGFGRLDMVENRRVGIKSRETYECPGALALLMAHADLEDLTLERDVHHEKARLEPRWSELVYDGLWFSPLKQALDAFFTETQRHVTGEVRLRPRRRPVLGGRPAQPGQPLRLRAGHLRRHRHLPPRGCRGLRPAVGTGRRHLVGRAGRDGGAADGRRLPMTLWHGRLGGGMADVVMEYSTSLHFDRTLAARRPDRLRGPTCAASDGAGCSTHRRGRGAARGPRPGRRRSWPRARSPSPPTTRTSTPPIERRVTEIAGDVGAKLHTGRSRNDQIATDLRLYAKRELRRGGRRGGRPPGRAAATGPGRRATPTCPGYTHLQRAQPVLLAHHLLAHGWALARDVDRLLATVDRLDVSPLGAGALAGSSLPLDPDGVAEDLGFGSRFENSLDAVSDRDFVAEALFDLALLGVHLSRIGEELVAVVHRRVRLRHLRRRLRHRQLDAPAEEEPRCGRAGPGQVGTPHREPDRAAGHPQGPAPLLQP